MCRDETAQAPRSPLLFFSFIWHTQIITGAGETPPTPDAHTPRSQYDGHLSPAPHWLPNDGPLMEVLMHAVFFCYHSAGKSPPPPPAEPRQTLRFRRLRHHPGCCLLPANIPAAPLELEQVVTCTLSDNGEWECRRKRKWPETRASGQVEEDPLMSGYTCEHLAAPSLFLSVFDAAWAVNESESFSSPPWHPSAENWTKPLVQAVAVKKLLLIDNWYNVGGSFFFFFYLIVSSVDYPLGPVALYWTAHWIHKKIMLFKVWLLFFSLNWTQPSNWTFSTFYLYSPKQKSNISFFHTARLLCCIVLLCRCCLDCLCTCLHTHTAHCYFTRLSALTGRREWSSQTILLR